MKCIVIGNSGSGKSTLARQLGEALDVPPIDLDVVYWEPDQPGVARPLAGAVADLKSRIRDSKRWVVEGCYENLAEALLDQHPVLIWLDPGEDTCVSHCQQRPWEPHKYPSKAAQDENLAMLIDWVRAHYEREGLMSYDAHRQLFARYRGPKLHVQDSAYAVDEILRAGTDRPVLT